MERYPKAKLHIIVDNYTISELYQNYIINIYAICRNFLSKVISIQATHFDKRIMMQGLSQNVTNAGEFSNSMQIKKRC